MTGSMEAVALRTTSADGGEVESLLACGLGARTVDGNSWASRQWFELAYDQAEQAGDVPAMAVAMLGQGGLRVAEQRAAAGEVMLARLRRLEPEFDPLSSIGLQIRARLAAESDYRAGEHRAILEVLEEATRVGDPAARAAALSLAHHCLLGPDGPERAAVRRTLAIELIGESSRTGRRSDLLMGLLWQTVDMFIDGDRHAERRLGELKDALAQGGHLAIANAVSAIEVMLSIRAGHLDRAEAQARACRRRGSAIGDIDATGVYVAHIAAIRWYQGRMAELQPMLAELVHSPTLRAVDNAPYGGLALAAATAGDRLTAASTLAALSGRDPSDLVRSCTWLSTMYGIVETAYLLDDTETCARVHELLSPYADLPAVAGLGVLCLGSVQHTLGVAALTTGQLDRAVEHLRAAVRDNLALRHWPALIMSRVRYAQALTRRGQSDDLSLARNALATARQEADSLGLPLPEYGDEQPGDQAVATCSRTGQRWLVEYGRRSVLIPNSVGMSHLAVLLANPGQDVPAVELAAGLNALHTAAAPGQPVLDRTAILQYRGRIAELNAEIDDFEGRAQPERAAQALAERDWLLSELASAAGLGGRARRFSSEQERARLAVGKAIRRSIGTIARADPQIGAHLDNSVKTGMRCSYRPPLTGG